MQNKNNVYIQEIKQNTNQTTKNTQTIKKANCNWYNREYLVSFKLHTKTFGAWLILQLFHIFCMVIFYENGNL